MATDTRITLLEKDGEQLQILFSPSRERLQKEILVKGRVEAMDSIRGDERRYRREIRSSIKWGWKILSSDQTDLFGTAQTREHQMGKQYTTSRNNELFRVLPAQDDEWQLPGETEEEYLNRMETRSDHAAWYNQN